MTQYRPEIDGLRTVAVLAVIIFHLNSDFLIGGYYGVDVFFVISGYLITGILTKSIGNDNFNMWEFWLRRVKRIIPLLLTVIITTTLVLPFLLFRPTLNEILKDIIPAIFSYFNFYAYFNFGDYWGQTADRSFLLHTWSLSVEEQFYLIYPFALFISQKYFKNFLIPLIIITTISLGLFLFFVNIKTQLVFYMLPFRIWELTMGGMITCLPKKVNNTKNYINLLPVLGLILILIGYFFSTPSLSYIAVLPVFGSCFIIYFSTGKDVLGKMLSSNMFVHIGKLSYSLYLWHWPVIVLYKNLEFKFLEINKFYIYVIILLITYVLAYISYTLIETKLRNYNKTPKLVLVGIGVCFALITFYKSSYFSIHYPSSYKQQIIYGLYYDVTPKQEVIKKDNQRFYNVIFAQRLNHNKDAYKTQGIVQILNNKNPQVLILGDSHGVGWVKPLLEATKELQVSSSVYTTNASRPFFNLKNLDSQTGSSFFTKQERIDFIKSILKNIDKWKVKLVIMSCRWENISPTDKVDFENLIKYLGRRNIKLLVINQPPHIYIMGDNNASQFISYLKINPVKGFNSISLNQDRIIESNRYLNQISHENDNVVVFDVFNKLYQNGAAKITYNDEVLYFDDDHLSTKGTELYKEDLKNVIKDCVK
jgi:peptidoglycan/LPS O-acetylase OafA/YrhL